MALDNHWEQSALEYRYPDDGDTTALEQWEDGVHDATIHPGLYSGSGFDLMTLLVRVHERENPVVKIGAVDSSCALLVCDLAEPDTPIVYVTEAFTELTGYSASEVMGTNCRFLQSPGGKVKKGSVRNHVDKDHIKKMKRAVEKKEELQLEVVNFRKNGKKFVNVLTMIPVKWDSSEYRYMVGLMVEKS